MISRFPLVILILFFLLACQNNQTNIGINNKNNDCPINPEKLNNIKEISINEIAYTHSGMVKSGQDVGYKFRGKKGKNLELKTQSDICLWIYTPTGEKLNLDKSSELPMDGNYIIQLSKNQGATTYDLILSLKQKKETNINISKSKPYIKEYILNHYKKLNDRQYKKSWQELTSNFQNNKAINYSEYTNWWNKVDYIEIKKIDVIEQKEEQAIIEVSIKYKMKTGKSFYDNNNQILIIWNSQKEIWQIDDKAYQIDNNKSKNDVSEAVNLIKNLYFDLSEKDFQSAKKHYDDSLAFQFNEKFFRQFDRVTVENLQVISNNSSSIDFIGYNTYYYPDGSTQREKRSYRVTTIQGSLKITASEFIKVTKFRS